MIKKLKKWWFITKMVFKGEPIKSWRINSDGLYYCDGDCGKYAFHGLCTCGLKHYYRPIHGGRDNMVPDRVYDRRAVVTKITMQDVPMVYHCVHDVHYDHECGDCTADAEKAFEKLAIQFGWKTKKD